MNILIVEDNSVSAKVLRKTLENLGHVVTVADGGKPAWERFQQERFEVVISDWMMPEMDGLELCRRIRSHKSESYTYIILLTAKGQREDRLEGLRAGADDLLIKPLYKEELAARLMEARRRTGHTAVESLRSEMRDLPEAA